MCEFFSDNLKDNQIICNTFFAEVSLKPRSIKIILFVLNILLYFVINALFINDDYISEIYHLENENFFSFISRSISRVLYTTVVSLVLEFIVGFFFVEEAKLKRIYLREKDNKVILDQKILDLITLIKKSYIGFIIFVFVIFIICFYYIICFNSIYPKIQIEWIKSSVFILFIRQVLSVLQCLLETLLRFIALCYESEKMFKISKLIN